MKKLFKFFPMLVMAVLGASLSSCTSDDDKVISTDRLPVEAKTFIKQYFPKATVLTLTEDKDEYKVRLSEGTSIEFTKAGEWKDVDAQPGRVLPKGFYPAEIDNYVATNYGQFGINEISKERRGYDVELTSYLDLIFSPDGNYLTTEYD